MAEICVNGVFHFHVPGVGVQAGQNQIGRTTPNVIQLTSEWKGLKKLIYFSVDSVVFDTLKGLMGHVDIRDVCTDCKTLLQCNHHSAAAK